MTQKTWEWKRSLDVIRCHLSFVICSAASACDNIILQRPMLCQGSCKTSIVGSWVWWC